MSHSGAYVPPTQEKVHKMKILKDQLQQDWKMLQCSGKSSVVLINIYVFKEMTKYNRFLLSQWDIEVSGSTLI